jgi:hypothetical protein
MPNTIKYSTTGDTLSLKKGNFFIGTGDVGKGPTSATTYWNGISPPSGGYSVYKNKVSNGPAIWTAASDNQLVSLTNNIEGTSFTTAQQCINYFATQSDKMVLNKDYESIVTSGLTVCLDAGFLSSYPGSGTTWYDISGNDNHFTLYNGLSYRSLSGGTFSFDGTNDYARSNSTIDLSVANAVTVQVIGNAANLGTLYEHSNNWNTNPGGFGLSTNSDGFTQTNQYMHFYWNTNGGTSQGARNFGPVEQAAYFFVSTKVLIKNNLDGLQDYYNGSRVPYVSSPWGTGTTTVGNVTNFRNDYFYVGGRGGSSAFLQGNISLILIYNRALSASEILQNYNASLSRFNTQNIVKNGLVLNLDSSNTVSYPTSGTTWTDLSGYGNKGTLTNGPTFDSTSKTIVLDGVDDYVVVSPSNELNTLTQFTYMACLNISSSDTYGAIIARSNSLVWYAGNTAVKQRLFIGGSATGDSNTFLPSDRFSFICVTWDGTTVRYYFNGSPDGTATNTSSAFNTTPINIGRYQTGEYFQGKMSDIAIYNRSLSPTEIQQNYYQAPIVTSGLVMALDAGNLVSYLGSGTTWRDLTTNGNNGTLTNGPTFNSANGGSIDFDGSDDWVQIPTYTFGNGNWSVNVWVNADSLSNFNLISNSSGGPVTNAFGFDSNKIFYRNYNGNWQGNVGNTILSTNTWYMLTWVNYAGASESLGTMQMFVNGISDSSTFNSYTTNGGPCNAIGRNWFSNFSGEIGNVQFYNKSLTLSEVAQNYNAYKSRFGL